jgi:4-hydroxythreonine-4-phosphate dehydrogenase
MSTELQKPVIGFSCGDLNGIGTEIIIKNISRCPILDMCVPVIFASNKSINYNRKSLPEVNFVFTSIKEVARLNPKQVNVLNCWEEEVAITPGKLNDAVGNYAYLSLNAAVQAIKDGQIDGLVTAPIHKKSIQSADFNFSGHTPYLKDAFGVNDVAMLLVSSIYV